MHRCLLSPYSRGETRPQEPPFGPGRGLSKAVAAEITCGRGCGEGGICVGLGRQGALCSRAQVGKYIGQALSCTHPPRSQAPNAFCPGKKRRHCVHWLHSKRNIPVVLLFGTAPFFKKEKSRCENLSPIPTHLAHQVQISCCLHNINESMNPSMISAHTYVSLRSTALAQQGTRHEGTSPPPF